MREGEVSAQQFRRHTRLSKGLQTDFCPFLREIISLSTRCNPLYSVEFELKGSTLAENASSAVK